MSTIEIPSLAIEIEVLDQDQQIIEIDGSDLRLNGESGTLEVILMGYSANDEEKAMLDVLRNQNVVSVDGLAKALETTDDPIEFVLGLEPEQKLAIVKAIMQEM